MQMEEILLLAQRSAKEDEQNQRDFFRRQNEEIERLNKKIKSFFDGHYFKEHSEDLKNLVQMELRIIQTKKELEALMKKRSDIDERLKKECEHDFHNAIGEDDRECSKCGWYESEI